MEITILTALQDNYIYMAADHAGNALVVDPAESRPVLDCLQQNNLTLSLILTTHSHADHTGGIETLKHQTDCRVFGPQINSFTDLDPKPEPQKIDSPVGRFQVLLTPGHTSDSVCFYLPASTSSAGVVFTGDILFVNGCGRLFSGDAQSLWQSLRMLAALPDETLVYCGHEYTEENYRFALTIEPDNAAIRTRLLETRQALRKGRPTVPSTIGREKQLNPFLRADTAPIRRALSMPDAPAWQVFAELRKRKDRM